MANVIRCDGDCGKESPDATGTYVSNNWMVVIAKRPGDSRWHKHRLCDDCAKRNILLLDKNGQAVSTSGFASEVLR